MGPGEWGWGEKAQFIQDTDSCPLPTSPLPICLSCVHFKQHFPRGQSLCHNGSLLGFPLFPKAKVGFGCKLRVSQCFPAKIGTIHVPLNKLLGGQIFVCNREFCLPSWKACPAPLSNWHFPDLLQQLEPFRNRALVTEYQTQQHFQILPFISGPTQILPLISEHV